MPKYCRRKDSSASVHFMVGPKNVKTSATSLLQQRQHIDGVLYNYGNSSLSNFTGERKKLYRNVDAIVGITKIHQKVQSH